MGKVETQESAWVHTGGHPDHTGAASVVWSSADAEEKTELQELQEEKLRLQTLYRI